MARSLHAPSEGPRALERSETMRAWGRRYARLVVERCHGNKREASRFLGISYHTLVGYLTYSLEASGANVPPVTEDAGEEAELATATACAEPVEV